MRQVALILDEHSTRSPLIDYAAWWQQREAADFLCWVREEEPVVRESVPLGYTSEMRDFKPEPMRLLLDLRLRNVTYFNTPFDPRLAAQLAAYVDVIGLCRQQYNILQRSIEAKQAEAPQTPIFVPGGFPPPSQVLVHLNMDAIKAAVTLKELLVPENRIILLAFDNESPSSQKKIVQYAQSYFGRVGLTHAGNEVTTLALNFLPKDALVVASMRVPGESRRLFKALLNLPLHHALSFLLVH